MKSVNWMVALGAVALVSSSVQAAPLPAPFMASYEGDVLPNSASSNPQWSVALNDTSGSSGPSLTGTGSLKITTTASESLAYRILGGSGSAWDPTGAGSTVEVDLKVDSQDSGAGRAGGIYIGTSSRVWLFRWGPTVISEELFGGSYFMTTDDVFHTYRFVIPDDSGPLTMYVDGTATPSTWTGIASRVDVPTDNRIDFGDTLNGDGGVVEWNYVRWTNAGAYAPEAVPEPGTLGVLALGGLTLLRRRA